jgi:tRNA pseudouridine55 synthase
VSVNGFLIVDKAGGMTSHDVVAKLRKRFATKKIGHAGTLDPMATGVLVIGIGSATRLLQYVTDGIKEYEATIRLGSATHTDDREGEVISTADASMISDDQIQGGLTALTGKIMQKPSAVSAIKIDGKRAHERVRDGEDVDIPAREVEVNSIDILAINRTANFVDIDIRVKCSAGTYIRAIARDLGLALDVGGHLTSLRRTLVSPFAIAEASDWESGEPIAVADGISKILPTRTLDFAEMNEISFGRYLDLNSESGVVAALSPAGEFAALLENKEVAGKSVCAPILVAVKE